MDVPPGSAESYTRLAGHCHSTYQFRAPELFVVKKKRGISYSTDVWAVGVILIEMDQSGKMPFGRQSRARRVGDTLVFQQVCETLYKDCLIGKLGYKQCDDINPALFFRELSKLELVDATKLPWAKERPLAFKTS